MGTPQNADLHTHYLRSLGAKTKSTAGFFLGPKKSKKKAVSQSTAAVEAEDEPTVQDRSEDPPVQVIHSEDPGDPAANPEDQDSEADPQVDFLTIMAHPVIKPEPFSGKPGEKAVPWLQELRRICKTVYKQTDEQVEASFMYYLTGQAKAWYSSLPEATKADAEAVLELFIARFDGSDAALTVTQVRQASCESVMDYTTRYLEATCQQSMPELWKLTTYVDGLKPAVRRIVKPQKLKDVEDARQAALRAEHSEQDCVEVNAMTSPMENQMATLTKQVQDLARTVSQLALQQQQHFLQAAPPLMPPPVYNYSPEHMQPPPSQPPHDRTPNHNQKPRHYKGKGRNNSYHPHNHQQGSQNDKARHGPYKGFNQ